MSAVTINNLQAQVPNSANQLLLLTERPDLIFNLFATQDEHPEGGGDIHTYRHYQRLPLNLTPLPQNGQNPAPIQSQVNDFNAQLQQYGAYTLITTFVSSISQEDVVTKYFDLYAQWTSEMCDQLLKNVLIASTSTYYCQYGVSQDDPTEITSRDIQEVTARLRSNSAIPIMNGKIGELRIGSSPVRNCYALLCHTDLEPQFNQIGNFTYTYNYPNYDGVLESEYGAVLNARAFTSQLGSYIDNASALGERVYLSPMVSMESFAHIKMNGQMAQYIYTPAGSGQDYLRRTQAVGAIFTQAQTILNQLWVDTMRCTLN
jgi:N4-gp56 family major capsid protein